VLVARGHVDPGQLAIGDGGSTSAGVLLKKAVAQIDGEAAARRGEDRPGQRRARRGDQAARQAERLREIPVVAVARLAVGDRTAPVAAVDAVFVARVEPVIAGERARATVDETDEADRRAERDEVRDQIAEARPPRNVDVAIARARPGARQARAVGQAEVRVLEDDHLAGEPGPREHAFDQAPRRRHVGHPLVPPLRAHLDEHDVARADESFDAAQLRQRRVDVVAGRAAARGRDAAAVARGIVGQQRRRGREVGASRPPVQPRNDRSPERIADGGCAREHSARLQQRPPRQTP